MRGSFGVVDVRLLHARPEDCLGQRPGHQGAGVRVEGGDDAIVVDRLPERPAHVHVDERVAARVEPDNHVGERRRHIDRQPVVVRESFDLVVRDVPRHLDLTGFERGNTRRLLGDELERHSLELRDATPVGRVGAELDTDIGVERLEHEGSGADRVHPEVLARNHLRRADAQHRELAEQCPLTDVGRDRQLSGRVDREGKRGEDAGERAPVLDDLRHGRLDVSRVETRPVAEGYVVAKHERPLLRVVRRLPLRREARYVLTVLHHHERVEQLLEHLHVSLRQVEVAQRVEVGDRGRREPDREVLVRSLGHLPSGFFRRARARRGERDCQNARKVDC